MSFQQNCDNVSQTGLQRMAAKSASMIFNNRTGLPTQSSPVRFFSLVISVLRSCSMFLPQFSIYSQIENGALVVYFKWRILSVEDEVREDPEVTLQSGQGAGFPNLCVLLTENEGRL